MSAAVVPGLIRLAAPSSGFEAASNESSFERSLIPGLLGPNWTSGIGGGEGSRGELDGETPERDGATAAMTGFICFLSHSRVS
jgi:hypothetical protein